MACQESLTTALGPRPGWTGRDVVIGITVVALYRALSFIPPEWFAGIPSWPLLFGGLLLTHGFLLGYPYLLARRRGLAGRFALPGMRRIFAELPRALVLTIGVALLLSLVGQLVRLISPETSMVPEVWKGASESGNPRLLIAVLLFACTLGPVCEEVFFRGFLHDALRSRMPRTAAAVVQSALFAVTHTYGGLHLALVFLLGIILTVLYEWRKSLLSPILVHAGLNLVAAVAVAGLMVAHADRPMLGVKLQDRPEGCQVRAVAPDSAAEEAGVLPGDLITEIEGVPIRGGAELRDAMLRFRPGDSVTVSLVRNGRALSLEAVLRRPPEE